MQSSLVKVDLLTSGTLDRCGSRSSTAPGALISPWGPQPLHPLPTCSDLCTPDCSWAARRLSIGDLRSEGRRTGQGDGEELIFVFPLTHPM
jgi:hypothetical protein